MVMKNIQTGEIYTTLPYNTKYVKTENNVIYFTTIN